MTFEVIQLKELGEGAYPLFLGCGFLCQCSVVVNWAGRTFIYRPKDNRTIVTISSRGLVLGSNGKRELPTIQSMIKEATGKVGFIKCIGPRFYDFVNDGSLTQWLQEHPYSSDEAFVIIKERPSNPS
jgi:hypothetical protein